MKKFIAKIFIAVFLILFFEASAFAQGIGKLTKVLGRVDILRPDREVFTAIREDDEVFVGDVIRTKSDSRAEIEFSDKTILRLAEDSKIKIEGYQLDKDNKRLSAVIGIERGKLRTIIAKMPHPADFNIITPNAQGTVKGSDVFVFYQAGSSGMLVNQGRLSVINKAHPDTKVIIPAGNSVLVSLEDLPKGPRQYLSLEKTLHQEDTDVGISKKAEIITGVITALSGDVKVKPKNTTTAHNANINEVLNEGDSIETGIDGLIQIKLDNGNAISLKPNTKLIITKLVFDLKTGKYENLFESNMGKIMARIENIGGGSKFEIKTPTAVTGARGTIMYVEIQPDMTRSFFEGGSGFIANLTNGITQDIAAGQNASSDRQGNVSQASYTPQDTREAFSEGWQAGSGIEGYSAPEGTTGTYFFNSDTNTSSAAGGGAASADLDVPEINTSNDIPITETIVTTPATFTQPIFINGQFLGYFGRYEDNEFNLDSGSISGILEGQGSFSGNVSSITLSGDFLNSDNLQLWGVDVSGQTDDGATFLGIIGGTSINNSLEALLLGLYIRPDAGIYRAGYITSEGLLTGNFYPESNTFGMAGNLVSLIDEPSAVSPGELINEEFEDVLNPGNFSGDISGDITGKIYGESINLQDQLWALWRAGLGGTFQNLPSNNWTAIMAGVDVDEESDEPRGVWFVDIIGGTFSENKLSAILSGSLISYDTKGEISGRIIGAYELTANTWQALSAGVVSQELLAFVSPVDTEELDDEGAGIFYPSVEDGEDVLIKDGNLYGLVGGTQSLWLGGAVPVSFIGKFSLAGNSTNYIWAAPFVSYNYRNDTYTTYDDDAGAYFGFMGGIYQNTMTGLIKALYIDNNNNTGYLSGSLSGEADLGVEMFRLDGELQRTEVKPGINIAPEALVTCIEEGSFFGLGKGGFSDGAGTLDSRLDGFSLSIANNELDIRENWGIWAAAIFGSYTNPINSSWDMDLAGLSYSEENDERYIDGAWLGQITGNLWQAARIEGELKGIWLGLHTDTNSLSGGTLSGEVQGGYIEVDENTGNFQAVGAGEWVEVETMLNTANLDNEIIGLGNLVSLPITEVHAALLTGNGAFDTGGVIQANMDMSFYATDEAAFFGIWAALIDGTYVAPQVPVDTWSVNLNNAAGDIAELSGTQWSDGQWQADVAGQTVDGRVFGGVAAGTYDESQGDFSGVGTGTWKQQ